MIRINIEVVNEFPPPFDMTSRMKITGAVGRLATIRPTDTNCTYRAELARLRLM